MSAKINVAEVYPPVTDSNGNTWYKSIESPGHIWGWTSQVKYAHEDYGLEGAQEAKEAQKVALENIQQAHVESYGGSE